MTRSTALLTRDRRIGWGELDQILAGPHNAANGCLKQTVHFASDRGAHFCAGPPVAHGLNGLVQLFDAKRGFGFFFFRFRTEP